MAKLQLLKMLDVEAREDGDGNVDILVDGFVIGYLDGNDGRLHLTDLSSIDGIDDLDIDDKGYIRVVRD